MNIVNLRKISYYVSADEHIEDDLYNNSVSYTVHRPCIAEDLKLRTKSLGAAPIPFSGIDTERLLYFSALDTLKLARCRAAEKAHVDSIPEARKFMEIYRELWVLSCKIHMSLDNPDKVRCNTLGSLPQM